ncbi:GGDEF domain-containing protein [Pararhizobium sp. LjRoot255]|uniref:GGDEF domain-containing protein n=1 Tax=Pararhizobium sp. LjRoot255 TaxID=3342298 RepID=UPI003ECDBD91
MADKFRQDGHQAQNAAVLLKVAQTMAKLGIAPFPRNYELFYDALCGQNAALTRDVASLGPEPAQSRLDEVGIKHHLPGFAAIATENIRADAAQTISAINHGLNNSIAKKEAFAALLRHFIDRLETDPVAGMSEFADDAGRLRDAVTAFEREERAFAISMRETVAQLGGIGSDIEIMRKASIRDPVTGLANRIAFSAKLAALYDDGNAAGPAALALVTVEGLRDLGESHGAATAEKALKKLAPVFRKSVKKNDFVARIGANEFAFVFHDVSADNADAIAQRIRASVEAVEITLPNRTFTSETLSLSTGIAMALTASSSTDLFTQAELALHAVRAGGGPGVLVFSAAIGSRATKTYSPHAA